MSLKSLTIEYLNKCNLNCEHCAVNAGVEAFDKVELNHAKEWIKIASTYGATDVYICGGEPFLVFDEICELAKHAKSLSLNFTTFSNAFWASTIKNAQKHLFSLQRNGLTSLHLSLDCFHLRQGIPLQNFINAASVANDLGLNLTLNIIQTQLKEISYNYIRRLFKDYKVCFQYGTLRPWGRAINLDKKIFMKEKKENLKSGCRNYASPIISPKGDIFACCGAYHLANSINPLRLGNIYDISFPDTIDKFSNLKLLHLIATFGPYFIYKLILNRDKIFLNNRIHICEFCSFLLNRKENIDLINERLKNPTKELKINLNLAELSCKNSERLRTHNLTSGWAEFIRFHCPALWEFATQRVRALKRFSYFITSKGV
jgi:hypothetical protein